MKDKAAVRRLKCGLCRRGLMKNYNVYEVSEEGETTLYSGLRGYLYRKGERHAAEVLEIAGQIDEGAAYRYRLLAFARADGTLGGKVGDLVDIGSVGIYRITGIWERNGAYWILDLEVWPYGLSC